MVQRHPIAFWRGWWKLARWARADASGPSVNSRSLDVATKARYFAVAERQDEATLEELERLIKRRGVDIADVMNQLNDPTEDPVLAARARLLLERAVSRRG